RPADGAIYRAEKGSIRKMTNGDIIDQFKLGETSLVVNSNDVNGFLDTTSFTKAQKIYANMAMALKYSHTAPVALMPRTFALDKKESVRETFAKGIRLVKRFEGVEDREEYVLSYGVNNLSPLCYDHDPVERILAHCDEKQPLWISPCGMALMTAPPSVAGMMAMTNAEALAGIVLTQLACPGLPVVYGNTSAGTNLKTLQLSIGSPESALICYATAGLADLYGMPFRTGGALSDAKDLDVQAGLESMMLTYATLDCGADLIAHGCGIMGSFNIISFEKYIVDEEIIKMCDRLLGGICCDEAHFCMDSIAETGPRGTFLKGKTPKMMKEEFYLPKFLNKEDPNQWQNKGAISVGAVCGEEVRKRIDSYRAPEITKEQNDLLMPYIPDAYKDGI
ncbi:MAG: trimethylamine methyltransferase family protein, partial [Eubacterium sp.]